MNKIENFGGSVIDEEMDTVSYDYVDDQLAADFFEAVKRGKASQVKICLNNGVDVNAKTGHGNTALMFAALNGDSFLVKFLLKHGADINTRNNEGKTALMDAVEKGHLDVVKLLLEKGIYINARLSEGGTALMISAIKGSVDITKCLIEGGADPFIKNNKSLTALDFAKQWKKQDIVSLLENYQQSIEQQNVLEKTILNDQDIDQKLGF